MKKFLLISLTLILLILSGCNQAEETVETIDITDDTEEFVPDKIEDPDAPKGSPLEGSDEESENSEDSEDDIEAPKAEAPTKITVKGSEFKFTPSSFTVNSGEKVIITYTTT